MRWILVAVLGAALATAAGSPCGAAALEAGVAVVDITPPIGYRLCGYFHERLATGVHDPLCAKAVVLRQGECRAAMVFCDLIALKADLSARVRQLAQQKTGIPQEHIVLAATHSHTGPLYAGAMRNDLHQAAVEKHGRDPQETVDYPAQLTDRLVRAIGDAQSALRPVEIQCGVALEPGLSFNRRFHLKNGTVQFNPGKRNPDIVRVAGPIDPEVGLVLFGDQDRRPLASLTVFALHLDTVGGTLYSADYPYYLEQTLRKKLGGSFVSIFGNGTCGDINHIDVSTDRAQKGGEETVRIGEALGARVLAELPRLKAVQPALAVRAEVVSVPLQKFKPDEIAWAKASMRKIGTSQLSFLDQVKAYKIMDLQLMPPEKLPILVQAVRLSDEVALVSLPGELFVDLGLAIKRASPFKQTMVVELAQDAPDYIPTRKAFSEGSYEVLNSRIAPGGGEVLAETATRLLKQLKP